MKSYRTIRYRIHTTRYKYSQLYQICGACRFVWNYFVEKLRDEYKTTGRSNWQFKELSKQFTVLRRDEVQWLQQYSCNIVRFSLRPIEVQYKKFFKDPKNNGLPKFKAK